MKESKLIWMQKEIQQMQKVLMVMIQRIEIIEKGTVSKRKRRLIKNKQMIQLLNGETWGKEEILTQMYDDNFYLRSSR